MLSRPPLRPFASIVLAAAVAVVGLAGCGTDDNTRAGKAVATTAVVATPGRPAECASGTLTGAGSTFVLTLAQQWIKDFGVACPGATINYQGVGSGAGVQQFLAGTVDFAGSDAVLKPQEQQAASARGGAVQQIPWAAGGVAVLYNVHGVKNLRLSPRTLAAIFAGTVTRWDDPKVTADNAGTKLPSEPIQVVHRSDGSGTTKVFTAFLTAVAGDVWHAGADKDVAWPVGQGAKGSDGVSIGVRQAEGAIGYAETSFARTAGLAVAAIRNASGRYVSPTSDAVTAALRDATVPADLAVKVSATPRDPAAYPISTTTWAIVFVKLADPAKAKLQKAFLLYALGPGQASAVGLGYAPLPQELAVRAQAAVYQLG